MTVTLVIPAYNEEECIERAVKESVVRLDETGKKYEVIVVDNASTDRTEDIVKRMTYEYKSVEYVHEPEPGRGRGVATGFEHGDGDVMAFMDADLATDMKHLGKLLKFVDKNGYDIAVGSRWVDGHIADRPLSRHIASKGFNTMVRTLFASQVRDHQCGFKAFSAEVVDDLLDDIDADHWFWDAEFLIRAQYAGYHIAEFPVDWEPDGDSSVNLATTIPSMTYGALRLSKDIGLRRAGKQP